MATDTRTRDEAAGAGEQDAERPKLADGIELIGEYEDSGYKEPPFVARREDGQMIQLARLLYLVAEEADGRRNLDQIAERVTERFGRGVSADNVRVLVEEKLRPLGVLAQADGSSPKLAKADPLLALRLRAAVVPPRVVRALTTVFQPLFHPVVVCTLLAAVLALDVWFFFFHGIAQGTRALLYTPLLLLMVLGLVALATAFHEIGHATAARYGGAEPGAMGVGVYIVWPAFYTDVTDAYRLGRGGRVRTDLGGVYFNGVFVLGTFGFYFLTGFEPLLAFVLLQHLQVLQQFLPFLRLDGYYLLSDLTGVPDMFARLKPTLKSFLPGRKPEPAVEQLKPWVRVATSCWVAALVPVMLIVTGMLVFNAPRMLSTAWDSFFVQKGRIGDALGEGDVLAGTMGGVQALFLVLPIAGLSYTFGKLGLKIGSGAWRWSDSPTRKAFVLTAAAAIASVATFVLVPNGDYVPIQPGERGTLQSGVAQFRHVATGRPGLTEQRKRELGEIVVERRSPAAEDDGEPQPPATTEPAETTTTETETGTETDGTQTETEPVTTTSDTTTTPTETTPTETEPIPTTTTETRTTP